MVINHDFDEYFDLVEYNTTIYKQYVDKYGYGVEHMLACMHILLKAVFYVPHNYNYCFNERREMYYT